MVVDELTEVQNFASPRRGGRRRESGVWTTRRRDCLFSRAPALPLSFAALPCPDSLSRRSHLYSLSPAPSRATFRCIAALSSLPLCPPAFPPVAVNPSARRAPVWTYIDNGCFLRNSRATERSHLCAIPLIGDPIYLFVLSTNLVQSEESNSLVCTPIGRPPLSNTTSRPARRPATRRGSR